MLIAQRQQRSQLFASYRYATQFSNYMYDYDVDLSSSYSVLRYSYLLHTSNVNADENLARFYMFNYMKLIHAQITKPQIKWEPGAFLLLVYFKFTLYNTM